MKTYTVEYIKPNGFEVNTDEFDNIEDAIIRANALEKSVVYVRMREVKTLLVIDRQRKHRVE